MCEPVSEAYTKEPAPFTEESLVRAQTRDFLCRMFRDTVGMSGSEYRMDANGLLIHTSPLDRRVQIVPQ